MALKWGELQPETEEQRNAESQIGAADVAELRARVAALSASGYIDGFDGEEIVVPAAITRGMLQAEAE